MGHPHKDLAWFKRSPKNIDLNLKTTYLTDRQFVCQTMILACQMLRTQHSKEIGHLTDKMPVKYF